MTDQRGAVSQQGCSRSEASVATERTGRLSTVPHDWQPDGGVVRFESHPHGEAPHVHTTCSKCGARAWFLEYQWELLSKGCAESEASSTHDIRLPE